MAKKMLYIYIRTFNSDKMWNSWLMRMTRCFLAFWLHECARRCKVKRFRFYIWGLIDEHPKLSQAVFEIPPDRPASTVDPCHLSWT